MKNIFLFLGAHSGELVRVGNNGELVNHGSLLKRLTEVTETGVYGKDIQWDEIHLFEPQTYHEESLQKLVSTDNRLRYHKMAVSNVNTSMPLYVKGGFGYCSTTLDAEKFAGELFYIYQVPVIDLAEWINNNTSEEDFVCVDMDIECEEYNLLPHLINSNIIDRIKYISVEFHHGKSNKWSKNQADRQIEQNVRLALGNKFLDHDTYFS